MPHRVIILCIEDESDLRAELAEELGATGYNVLTACDGASALGVLSQQTPDPIFCDVMMPGLNGIDLISEIRRFRPALAAVPIVLLTALADRRNELAGRLAGADDYLVKPIDYDLLHAVIRNKVALVERIRTAAIVPPGQDGLIHLSRRETEVLRELGLGSRTREIAAKFSLSEHTVSDYVKAIYSKLGISSRAEAVREALRRQLIAFDKDGEPD